MITRGKPSIDNFREVLMAIDEDLVIKLKNGQEFKLVK